ncbi:MAG: hypothetical protein C0605_12165, partial [Hyphomicrobiales bacterium]
MLEESERWFLWLPVGFGTGIALYFALPFEPSGLLLLVAGLTLGGALAALHAWRAYALSLLIIPLVLFGGMAAAKLRTYVTAAPVLTGKIGPVSVSGRVERVWKRPGGGRRLLLRTEAVQGIAKGRLPYRLRLTDRVMRGVEIQPGDAVRFRAVLLPPPDATRPGGFSYARMAWFERIGATGFVISPIQAAVLAPPGLLFQAGAAIGRWRLGVAARLRAGLEGEGGEVAAALITGDRGGLAPASVGALRDAGLAHLLAISGLHMALFGGGLFYLIRWLLALSPALALRAPIKKWAAMAALIGSLGYLVLSGGAIATQRALIMTGIMFAAIMLDRRAISLRNVALAALAILLWRPESLISVSFQMSFAAVTALIGVYESLSGRVWYWGGEGGGAIRQVRRMGRYLTGLALTSLVAGAATAPFALYHFHRVAIYGLAGNMLAVPVMGMVIMPAALAALIALPFGLEAYPLMVMGLGIDMVIRSADYVANLPGAVRHQAAFSAAALGCVVYGGLFLVLWRRRWRYLGLIPMALGAGLALMPERPDVLIDRAGLNIAVRGGGGHLALMSPRASRYSAGRWLLADGDARSPGQSGQGEPVFTCDGLGCIAKLPGGRKLAYVRSRGALREDCGLADIVVSRIPLRRQDCGAALVITGEDLKRRGAHEIRVT